MLGYRECNITHRHPFFSEYALVRQQDKGADKMCRNLVSACGLLLLCSNGANCEIASNFVTPPYENLDAAPGGAEFNHATVSRFVDPENTNWIAWNECPDLRTVNPVNPKEHLLGITVMPYIGVNDFIRLTVTNPLGRSLTVDIDRNGLDAEPIGTQSVIFGQAELAPDVYRYSPITARTFILNEAGSHNPIFGPAGTYTFDFSFRNQHLWGASNEASWLLLDVLPSPAPKPVSIGVWFALFYAAVLLFCAAGFYLRNRNQKSQAS